MASLRIKDLVKGGKFSRADILKRAWGYKNDRMCTQYRNDWKGAIKQAWADARMEMERQNAPEPEYHFNRNVSVAMLRACSCSEDMRRGNVCW